MATYKEYTVTSEGDTISPGTYKTYKTAAFTLGHGESYYAMKVANPNQSTTSIYMRGDAQTYFGGGGMWGTYATGDPSSIWTNGKGVSIQVVNSGSSGYSMRITVTIKVKLDKVVQGNKIDYRDRSKTGKSTTQGAVMKDSTNFESGEKIKASTFNTAYGL